MQIKLLIPGNYEIESDSLIKQGTLSKFVIQVPCICCRLSWLGTWSGAQVVTLMLVYQPLLTSVCQVNDAISNALCWTRGEMLCIKVLESELLLRNDSIHMGKNEKFILYIYCIIALEFTERH